MLQFPVDESKGKSPALKIKGISMPREVPLSASRFLLFKELRELLYIPGVLCE
jgi:hypothetical protein